MARPSKSSAVMSKNLTKAEIKAREKIENQLKGDSSEIKPDSHLTTRQVQIFKFIYEQLKASDILGNLDKYILSETAIIIDRINECESTLNAEGMIITTANGDIKVHPLIKIRNDYMKDYFRCCNELSLSPQSRAKFGNINLNKEKEESDKLLQILGGA